MGKHVAQQKGLTIRQVINTLPRYKYNRLNYAMGKLEYEMNQLKKDLNDEQRVAVRYLLHSMIEDEG